MMGSRTECTWFLVHKEIINSEHTIVFAGKPALQSLSIDILCLVTAYFALEPGPATAPQHVAFSTSGHCGSAFAASSNKAHMLAITQAACSYRRYAWQQRRDRRFQRGCAERMVAVPGHQKQSPSTRLMRKVSAARNI